MEHMNSQELLQQLWNNYDNHGTFLRKLGKKALKAALTMHFTAAHPDKPDDVERLVSVNLKKFHLKNAFENLYAKNLIKIFKVRQEDALAIDKQGTEYSLHNLAVIFGISDLNDVDKELLMNSLRGIKEKMSKKMTYCPWALLDKNMGLKNAMHKLALQVAGLMHVVDASTFWENYKPYMELVSRDTYLDGLAASSLFEDDMSYIIGALPCFSGCVTSTEIEETRDCINDQQRKGEASTSGIV